MGARLDRCSACGGFFSRGKEACPHCGLASKDAASVTTPGRRLRLGAVGGALGGGAIAFTLMACYGAPPPCPDGTRECYKNAPADTPAEPPASAAPAATDTPAHEPMSASDAGN